MKKQSAIAKFLSFSLALILLLGTFSVSANVVSTAGENMTSAPYTDAPVATEVTDATEENTVAGPTVAPTTSAPVSSAPATDVPTTGTPVTDAPTTGVPATDTPTTGKPVTNAPATEAPTDAPVIADINVYFTNTDNWDRVFVHYWDGKDGSEWISAEASSKETTSFGQGIFTVNVPENAKALAFSATDDEKLASTDEANVSQTVDIIENILDGKGFYLSTRDNATGFWNVVAYDYKKSEETSTQKDILVESDVVYKTENEVFYSGKGLTYTATFIDNIAGIDASTIKAYFGPKDSELKEVEVTIATFDEAGKIVKAQIGANFDEAIATGTYEFKVVVSNNVGIETEKSVTVNVDNSKPEISTAIFEDAWSNELIPVSFVVKDMDSVSGGINSVTVEGDANGKDYTVTASGDEYTFYADYYQKYTITATDNLGNSEVRLVNKRPPFDNETPVIDEFTYSNNNNATWAQSAEVTFTVHDRSESEAVLSGIKEVTVVGADGTTYDEVLLSKNDQTSDSEYKFTADKYQKYTVYVTDNAGNTSTATTAEILIDKTAPVVTEVKVEVRESVLDKVFRFLTFGIYDNRELVLVVYAEDAAPSSGIESITVVYGGKSLEMIDASTGDEVANASFVLPIDNSSAYDPANMTVYVNDVAGNKYDSTLQALRDKITASGDGASLDEAFEIVVSDKGASADEITVNYTATFDEIYSGQGKYSVVFEDILAGINMSSVQAFFGLKDSELKEVEITIATFDEADKIVKVQINFETGEIATGTYEFKVAVTNNSGVVTEKTVTVNVDNSKPEISTASFENAWSNELVPVSFVVKDMDSVSSGIKTVTVKGDANGKDYTVTASGDEYTFYADLYQTYTFTATDNLGNSAKKQIRNRPLFDNEAPVIGEFTYSNNNNATWAQSAEVTFTVHDRSESEAVLSGIKEVTIVGADGTTYDEVLLSKNDQTSDSEYKFTADKYQTYRVYVTDNAGNTATADTAVILIDKTAPVVTEVKVEVRENVLDKVFRFLTFGIYDNRELVLVVYAEDAAPSSGIESITVVSGEVVLKMDKASTGDEVANASFVLPVDNSSAYDPANMTVYVNDVAGNEYKSTLQALRDKITASGDGASLDEAFEIVVSDKGASADEIKVEFDKEYNGIYSGIITYTAIFKDEISGIDKDSVKAYFGTAHEALEEIDVTIKPFYNKAGKVKSVQVGYEAGKVATGTYEFKVAVTNNSGVVTEKSITVNVDNSEPVIFSASFDEAWSNELVPVTFTVTDGIVSSGIKNVTVKGNANNKTYEVAASGDEYTFYADLYQQYTIMATDNVGFNISATTDEVCFDNEAPVIGEFTYTNNNNAMWVSADVDVEFNISELSVNKSIVGTPLSGIKEVAVVGADGTTYDEVAVSEDAGVTTFRFTADKYQTYRVYVTDNAGNTATADTAVILIDKTAPVVTEVKVEVRENVLDKVFRFLTFGIYDNRELVLVVYAEDAAPSSGIESITVVYGGKSLEMIDASTGDEVANASFVLPVDNSSAYDPANMTVYVNDVAGNEYKSTLQALRDKITASGDEASLDEAFEIVVSDKGATITGGCVTEASYINGDEKWYAGDVELEYTITDTLAHIGIDKSNVKVTLNGTDITEYAIVKYAEINWGTKINNLKVYINTADSAVKNLVSRSVVGDTANAGNDVVITVMSNNGVVVEKVDKSFFFIDTQKPEVTEYKYEPVAAKDEYSTFDEADIIGEVMPIETTYGYYFKNDTKVTVTATDYASGSGVDRIILVAKDVVNKSYSINAVQEVNSDNQASFNIPAGFKGAIYAQAIDNVENVSDYYYPDNTVIEPNEKEQHDDHSEASVILTDTNRVVTAENQVDRVPLYNGDVTLELTIKDEYSGLNYIYYEIRHPDEPNINILEGEIKDLDKTEGNIIIDEKNNISWNVVARDKINGQDTNLITEMSAVVTIPTNGYNYNQMTFVLSGKDNSDYEIEPSGASFSIDTVAPVVTINYDSEKVNTYEGRDYFDKQRVATITVYERNFDPADFDWTKVTNAEGAVPQLVGATNWVKSTSVRDSETSEGYVHTATAVFTDDGIYSVPVNYVDECGNALKEPCHGGEFTIDNIDPLVSVTFDNNKVANGEYYDADRIATVKIVEHNFSTDAFYLDYKPVAFQPDNATTKTAPAIVDWNSDGDVHTAYIRFTDDGQYSFTIDYKDLALRAAEQSKVDRFYVDTEIGLPEFEQIIESKAYDGDIAPQIRFDDFNLDAGSCTYQLTKISYNFETLHSTNAGIADLSSRTINQTDTLRLVGYDNFPVEDLNDGIYKLSATIVDLAGNTKSAEIIFSVNRFGSTFMFGDEESKALAEAGFTNDAPGISIIEINVNPVTEQTVTVTRDTNTEDLQKDKDFRIQTEGGANAWYKYVYTIDKANFEEEGDYTLTITSKDTFDKVTNNRTQIEERKCPVSFVVDKTKPVISIEGVESGEVYKDATRQIKIMCMDTYINKESVSVVLDGNVLVAGKDYQIDDSLAGEMMVNIEIGENSGQKSHDISVSVKDYADNVTEEKVEDFILSANIFTLFLHSPIAIISTIAGLVAVAVIIILIARKKKKNA